MSVVVGPIEKDVALPRSPKSWAHWYKTMHWSVRFAAMETGDSFAVRCRQERAARLRSTLAVAANKFVRGEGERFKHFGTRILYDAACGWHVRVWRLR